MPPFWHGMAAQVIPPAGGGAGGVGSVGVGALMEYWQTLPANPAGHVHCDTFTKHRLASSAGEGATLAAGSTH